MGRLTGADSGADTGQQEGPIMTAKHNRAIRRRRLLQATAAGAAATLGVTITTAQTEHEIELEGATTGWIGRLPEEIEGERNPTLELVDGETYTLRWENVDGVGHNFVIEDEDGEEQFVETEIISGSGETQEVEFTAEEGMAEYFCAPHPQQMRGDIELVADREGGDDEVADVDDETEPDAIFGEGPTVGLETVADGLTAPTDFRIADEDVDRRFIVDQTGQVFVHGEDGLEEEPFLDVTDRMLDIDDDFDERGLLGLAFHPEFEENGRFYVRYSAEGEEPEHGAPEAEVPQVVDHLDRLSEFETADETNEEADPESEEILLEIPQPQFNHNAGPIAFGPDGYLYVTTGDGGGAGDDDEGHVDDWYDEIAGGNGQDTEHNLLGGILRIDVDDEEDERNYGIPADNPLADEDDHLPEYWAWGLRNPWGMSFENGEILSADVGQALFEIINHVEEGGNYGWNVWEGTHCFDPATPEEPPEECPAEVDEDVPDPRGNEPLLGPVIEYPQEADMGRYAEEYDEAGVANEERDRIGTAIVGGHLYEGDEVDELEGTYVFGDWSWDGSGGGRLFLARPPEDWLEALDDEVADVDDEDDDDTADDDAVDDDVDDEDDYHPPDEVDLWPMEELAVEDDGDIAEDGQLNHLVYAFGRDADGELYVLTTTTPTVEGEGFVSRIVPADEVEDDPDDDVEDDPDDDIDDPDDVDDDPDDVNRGVDDTDGNGEA